MVALLIRQGLPSRRQLYDIDYVPVFDIAGQICVEGCRRPNLAFKLGLTL